jgi:hypothetical protein
VSSRARARLFAPLAAAVLAASVVLPVSAAAAAEPSPAASAEPAPAPDPTGEADPAPNPTDAPEPAPTATAPSDPAPPGPAPSEVDPPADDPSPATENPDPTADPTPPADPAPATSAPAGGTVTYYGYPTRLSNGADALWLRVLGRGYLPIDADGVDVRPGTGVTVELAVPPGLTLSPDEAVRFLQLQTAAVDAPLPVLSASSRARGDGAAAKINVGPGSAATHRVWAVLVRPKGATSSAGLTGAEAKAAVAYADDYWSQQSDGLVGFRLQATVAPYTSAYSCDVGDDTNALSLWSEAAAKARTQGYVDGLDNHLVLFFPSGTDCGGAIGLGTVGYGVDSGGVLWSVGTDAPTEKATLAHELGHNLSLGHANWLRCTGTAPNYYGFAADTASCRNLAYGDMVDVMGYGDPGLAGGALSAFGAIRAGLWSDDRYEVVPAGATATYTLESLTTHGDGTRGVMIEDTDGVNYVVEFRDYANEDAPYLGEGCAYSASRRTGACVSNHAGVRVVRAAPNDYGDKGGFGDDVMVLGRGSTSSSESATRLDYTTGQQFCSRGACTTGVRVTVNAISGDEATITVTTTAAASTASDQVWLVSTYGVGDGTARTGETWSAVLADGWRADDYRFQWYTQTGSTRSAIAGADGPNFTVTPAQLGASLVVGVRPIRAGAPGPEVRSPTTGAVERGVALAASVGVDDTGTALRATPVGWPSGGSYRYQWYRGSSAISGATSSTYALTASDRGALIRARVVATPTGYLETIARSDTINRDVTVSGALTVGGTALVGATLSAVGSLVYRSPTGEIVPRTATMQWYRDASAITGATGDAYLPTAADLGRKLSVRVTSQAGAWTPVTTASAVTSAVGPGAIAGSFERPVVVVDDTERKLRADVAAGTFTTPGVTIGYQWYRGTAIIAGATSRFYAPVTADSDRLLKVRVGASRSGYTTRYVYSPAVDRTIATSGALTVAGTPNVGLEVHATELGYAVEGEPIAVEPAYRWYRNGSAIAGETVGHYVLKPADYGATITVKAIVSAPGAVSRADTSPGVRVLRGTLLGSTTAPAVTAAGSGSALKLSVKLRLAGQEQLVPQVDGQLPTAAYQWLRDGVPIGGATASYYAPTQADFGARVAVRITLSKAGFFPRSLTTAGTDYGFGLRGAPRTTFQRTGGEVLPWEGAAPYPGTTSRPTGTWPATRGSTTT